MTSGDGRQLVDTVLGPIEAAGLGATTMHDHVIEDSRVWYHHSGLVADPAAPVTLESLGDLRWNAGELAANLLLDEPDVAERELHRLVAAGGGTLVDVTTTDALGPRLPVLQHVARRTGLTIAVGVGWYVEAAHPPELAERSQDQLTEDLVRLFTEGVGDPPVRPALIGEIGTGDPITPAERKVLRACARAAAEVGAALSIHLEPAGAHGLEALEIALAQGLAPGRVILDHLDGRLDLGYHRELLAAGAVIEYDTFGLEVGLDYGSAYVRTPDDLSRIDALATLLHEGWAERIVLGCDVWLKTQLRTYGGYGYDHLLRRVVPMLRRRHGVDDATIGALLVDNPRRLLVRDRPDRGGTA